MVTSRRNCAHEADDKVPRKASTLPEGDTGTGRRASRVDHLNARRVHNLGVGER